MEEGLKPRDLWRGVWPEVCVLGEDRVEVMGQGIQENRRRALDGPPHFDIVPGSGLRGELSFPSLLSCLG